MKPTPHVLSAILALALMSATPSLATICQSGDTTADCPATVSKKGEYKNKETQAPHNLGDTSHSEGVDNLGSVDTHEHGVTLQDNSQPVKRVKEKKPAASASSPSTGTSADSGQPATRVKGEKPFASSSTPDSTTDKKSGYNGASQPAVVTDSHQKLQKYHETQQHAVQAVTHGAPTARSLPASGAQPHVTYWYHFATNDHMSTLSPLAQMEFRRRGYINPEGTVSEAGIQHGVVAVVDPQTPQLAAQVPQTTPTPDPVKHPVLQTSANPLATTPANFKYSQNGVGIRTRVVQDLVDSGYIRPDGSVTPSGANVGIVAEPFRTNPTPHLATTSGPTPTPTPNEIKAPPMRQAPTTLVSTAPMTPADFIYYQGGTRMSNYAVQQMINAGMINRDGSISPRGASSRVTAQALRPQPPAVPNLQTPPQNPPQQQVPVAQAVQAPNMVPQPQATPNLQAPPQNPPQQQVPVAQTLKAPNLVPPQPGQMQVPTPMDKPLGPGKVSKVPVPPDPGQMQVPTPQGPQVAQVPSQPLQQQVPQVVEPKQPSNTFRPANHNIPGFTYYLTDSHGVVHQIPSSGTVQRNPQLTNPDGTLTPNAIAKGWTMTMATPNMVPQPQATPNLQTPPQNPPQTQVPVAQTVQAPNMVPPQPGQAQVLPPTGQPTTAVPGAITHSLVPAESGTKLAHRIEPSQVEGQVDVVRPHPEQQVELYHPVEAKTVRYEEARQMKDDSFHLMVLGFKEP